MNEFRHEIPAEFLLLVFISTKIKALPFISTANIGKGDILSQGETVPLVSLNNSLHFNEFII
jgi:hypothetical protein